MKFIYRGYTIIIEKDVDASFGVDVAEDGYALQFTVLDNIADLYSDYGYTDFEACLDDAKMFIDGEPNRTTDGLVRLTSFGE